MSCENFIDLYYIYVGPGTFESYKFASCALRIASCGLLWLLGVCSEESFDLKCESIVIASFGKVWVKTSSNEKNAQVAICTRFFSNSSQLYNGKDRNSSTNKALKFAFIKTEIRKLSYNKLLL